MNRYKHGGARFYTEAEGTDERQLQIDTYNLKATAAVLSWLRLDGVEVEESCV